MILCPLAFDTLTEMRISTTTTTMGRTFRLERLESA